MEKIGEPVAPSEIVEDVNTVLLLQKIGYPVVLRPAYTLGGCGGGIAIMRSSAQRSWRTDSVFPVWDRFW